MRARRASASRSIARAPADRDTALRYNAAGALGAVYWVDSEAAYVVSGEGQRERLQKIAETAYLRMERSPQR